jgi:hypothetical protein
VGAKSEEEAEIKAKKQQSAVYFDADTKKSVPFVRRPHFARPGCDASSMVRILNRKLLELGSPELPPFEPKRFKPSRST